MLVLVVLTSRLVSLAPRGDTLLLSSQNEISDFGATELEMLLNKWKYGCAVSGGHLGVQISKSG